MPLSVLIVDGYEDPAETLSTILAYCGHQVRIAYDAEIAVAALAEDRPDVVIAETLLPSGIGYDLAAWITSMPGPRPYLIGLTTQSRRADRERGRAAGFRQFLIKPADPTEIVNLLQTVGGGGTAPVS
jgi:CheY-like chemotaxis protein